MFILPMSPPFPELHFAADWLVPYVLQKHFGKLSWELMDLSVICTSG